MIKTKIKHLIMTILFCLTINSISAKSIAYSLDGLLENSLHIGELTVVKKNENIMKDSLRCGFTYEFISMDIHITKTKFWSLSDLSIDKSYFVILEKNDTEILLLNDRFKQAKKAEQIAIKSDFDDCLIYLKKQNIVASPGGIFNMGIIGKDKYVKSDYLIINDTDFSLNKLIEFDDYCKINLFLASNNPITKYCLETFLQTVHK